jgi:hypothetical protein
MQREYIDDLIKKQLGPGNQKWQNQNRHHATSSPNPSRASGSRPSPKASEIVSSRKRKAPTPVLESDEDVWPLIGASENMMIPDVAEEKQNAEEAVEKYARLSFHRFFLASSYYVTVPISASNGAIEEPADKSVPYA